VATDTITVQPRGRLVHLDRLKILLTAGVITAHAAMSYGAAGTWLYEEDSLSGATALVLSVLVGGGVMFVLGLFFLMSGMLTTGPLQRRGPRRFLVSRLVRLGIPVLAYALVVWPMLQWLVDKVQSEAPSLWEFYRFEFSAAEWTSRGTGPMWFVAILLVVTVGWCLWRWRFRASPSMTPAGTTVAVAAVAVAVGTFFVRLGFPIDSPQFLDVHVWIWPQSLSLFVVGAIGAERGWISPVPRSVLSRCRWAVIGAVLLLALFIPLSNGPDAFKGGWYWEAAGMAVCEGAISVSAPLLVLDWARRHVVAHGQFERSLAESAYGAFVAQGPVLVFGALLLHSLDLAGDVKFVILAAVGVAGSFACGWAVLVLGRALTSRGR
jgi:glucans biosynthesis protein C